MEAPVPKERPVPHPPSYHTHEPPVPSEPPFSVSVTLLLRQTSPLTALLVALVAAVEGVLTVTLNEHEELLQAFVAVHVTIVVPALNVLPEAGEQTTVGAGSPVDVGVANVTTGLHVVMSEGQEPITGAVFTYTLNEQDELLQSLVAVHVTTVFPALNVLPDAGEQTTVGVGSPVAVGVANVTTGLHVVMSEGHEPMTGAAFAAKETEIV